MCHARGKFGCYVDQNGCLRLKTPAPHHLSSLLLLLLSCSCSHLKWWSSSEHLNATSQVVVTRPARRPLGLPKQATYLADRKSGGRLPVRHDNSGVHRFAHRRTRCQSASTVITAPPSETPPPPPQCHITAMTSCCKRAAIRSGNLATTSEPPNG